MIYRPIGKTGMSASVIGLGGEYLDRKPYKASEEVVGAALEHGINIIDGHAGKGKHIEGAERKPR